jgi:hypothetical protein
LPDVKDIVLVAFSQMESQLDRRIPRAFAEILLLFLGIRGKINFQQLSRYSGTCEQAFRHRFGLDICFLSLNIALCRPRLRGTCALAFDPSHISKSGRHTAGAGYFWSGCAGQAKWGLECCGLALLDLHRGTAFHLQAFQTVGLKEGETLPAFYARRLLADGAALLALSRYVAADAYFSKQTFVEPMCKAGFHVVSRLRDDASLRYLHQGGQKPGRGRRRIYGEKVDPASLDPGHALLASDLPGERIYSLKAHSKALGRELRLAVVLTQAKDGRWRHKIYCSTDTEMDALELLRMYRMRFQIEFLYRDAKQHTGLADCQARSTEKLEFHWNMALTAVNVAKIACWLLKRDSPGGEQEPFSMSDVKVLFSNELLLNRFISMFGINPERAKNKLKMACLRRFGCH